MNIRNFIGIPVIFLLVGSCGPAEKDHPRTERTLAETEARAKQIDEDCSSRLSARIDAVAWRVPNCMVVLTNMKAVGGRGYSLTSVNPELVKQKEGVTHMKLWLPDPASDDTTFQYEHTGHEFDENSPKRESTMPPHISIVEYRDGKGENFGNRVMNVRMSKEHQGDKFQLTVAFSATLADMQNKLPDIMITDGLYQSGWIREPKKPFMEPTTHTAGPDGKFASFGYAFTYGGKTADPNVRYVLVTNVFKYYNDRKNNIPVGKEIEKLFAEELRKSRYKPETHLAKDLLGTTTRILPWDGEKSLSTVANIRADRIAGWKEHGQPGGGTYEVVEVQVPESFIPSATANDK